MNAKRNPNRGILQYETGKTKFSISRHKPSADLAFFIQHYWLVDWDLRGQAPHCQEVLQHPGVNVVFQRGHSRINGIENKKSAYILQEQGEIVGVLFRPGAFHCYFQAPVAALTNRIADVSDYFPIEPRQFERELFAQEDKEQRIGLVERLLRTRMPERDNKVDWLNDVIEAIIHDRSLIKVEQVVERFGVTTRTLQRLFHQYVGVSPKWVIQRYRMHEAGELIEAGTDIAQLAAELGYTDQAHFSKDFKAAVGKPPKQYARMTELPPE
ncbi:helix-turn-helix domain-containing protein [Paenibacillus sp. NPDC056579]|uniref:helix-turn-helix domain-containing protein n=1 Tax=Paenibacillus sp. NPDC056579 TaxID=3345871 RepID=UPI003682BA7D